MKQPGKDIYGRIYRSMVVSKAFVSLPTSAIVVLCYMLAHKKKLKKIRAGKYISEENDFYFTYKESEANLGFNKLKFVRAIDKLLAKGFISIQHKGGMFKRDRTLYRFENHYIFWTKDSKPIFTRSKDIKRGYTNNVIKLKKRMK